jgi:hypothetical protein
LDKKQFWKAISTINLAALPDEIRALEPLEQLLVSLDAEDIVDFNNHLSDCLGELNTIAHFTAAVENQTDDLFLALRCWVVAQGQSYYDQLRKDALKTPAQFVALSGLSKTAQRAWAIKTGAGESAFTYLPKVMALTFGFRSKKSRWAPASGTMEHLRFADSRELVDYMLSINRREEPRIADHHDVVANAYLRQLQARAFRVCDCKMVSLTFYASELNDRLPHGRVALRVRQSGHVDIDAGVEVAKYLALTKPERVQLFVDVTHDALLQLADQNGNASKIVDDARAAVMRTLAQPKYTPPRYFPVPFAPDKIPTPVAFVSSRSEPVLLTASEEQELEANRQRLDGIAKNNGIKYSIWAIEEVDNFDAVPYPHAHTLLYEDPLDDEGNISVALQPNATWLELWRAADNAIRRSNDADHIYIEFLGCDDDGIVRLITGS